jgi:Fic family protein
VDDSRLAKSPVGSLVPIAGYDPRTQREFRAKAFVPNELPEDIPLSPAAHLVVARAASLMARADQATMHLPNPELLVRPAIRQEAVSTSALEGTYAPFSEVLKSDLIDPSDLTPQVAEVRNYITAAERATDWVRERPITLALLEHLQGILVQGTASDTSQAGRIRTTQVFIGLGGVNVQEARFIPSPSGHLLRDGLLAWEGWINRESHTVHPLVKTAVGHYQFETLHPFNDGNGRLGRLVVILQLMAAGELSLPIVNLSPWLEVRRRTYQDHLFEVSATGDFEPWVLFFCEAVAAQAKDAVERVRKLMAIKQDLMDQLRAVRAKGVSLRIAEDLIGYPMLTVNSVASRYDVTYPAANTAVGKLVDMGILRQFSEGNYGRIFICDRVMSVIQP